MEVARSTAVVSCASTTQAVRPIHGTITSVAAHGGTAYVGTSTGSLQKWALSPGAASEEPVAILQLTPWQPVTQLQVLHTSGLLLRLSAVNRCA